MIASISSMLGYLSLIGQIIIISLLIIRFTSVGKNILPFIQRYSLIAGFIVALVATLGSLFYSDIAHYEPCKLCWYQRILMYPQTILLGIAAARRDTSIRIYALTLSIIGAIIAFYHYLLQRGITPELMPCSAVGYSVSCSEKFFMQFGYMTIPLMALTAFLMIISFLSLSKSKNEK